MTAKTLDITKVRNTAGMGMAQMKRYENRAADMPQPALDAEITRLEIAAVEARERLAVLWEERAFRVEYNGVPESK